MKVPPTTPDDDRVVMALSSPGRRSAPPKICGTRPSRDSRATRDEQVAAAAQRRATRGPQAADHCPGRQPGSLSGTRQPGSLSGTRQPGSLSGTRQPGPASRGRYPWLPCPARHVRRRGAARRQFHNADKGQGNVATRTAGKRPNKLNARRGEGVAPRQATRGAHPSAAARRPGSGPPEPRRTGGHPAARRVARRRVARRTLRAGLAGCVQSCPGSGGVPLPEPGGCLLPGTPPRHRRYRRASDDTAACHCR